MRKKTDTRTNAKGRPVMSGIPELKPGRKPLGTSKEKYRILFESMQQGAFFQDADGRLIDVNPKALQIVGLTRQEFLHRTSHAPSWNLIRENGFLLPAQEYPSMVALKTGLPVIDKIVGVFNSRTNACVWIVATAIPLFLPGERTPYQVCVTLHDITERKRAKAELLESEQHIRTICNNIPNGMIYQAIRINNHERKITYLSDTVREFYGITPQEGIANANLVYDRFHEEDRERINKEEELAHETMSTFKTEARVINHKGEIRWSLFVSSPKKLPDGTTCWDGIEFDITERKQLEKRLHESEELFRLNFENAPIGICIFDKKGALLQANLFCETCFGHSREDLMRQGIPCFLHPDDKKKTTETFLTIVNNHEMRGQSTVLENRFFGKDGQTVYTKQHIQGVFNKDGTLEFITVLTEDITATKQLTLMNAAIINKLKDVHSKLKEFDDLLPENKKFLSAKSLDDYSLSPMENRIASMIFHGNSNKKIAQHLCISENTVKHHITSIYNKMKVKNRIGFINTIRTNRIII